MSPFLGTRNMATRNILRVFHPQKGSRMDLFEVILSIRRPPPDSLFLFWCLLIAVVANLSNATNISSTTRKANRIFDIALFRETHQGKTYAAKFFTARLALLKEGPSF